MMRPGPEVTVYLCVAPVDMRKQAASLALLVEQSLGPCKHVGDRALTTDQPLTQHYRLLALDADTGFKTTCVRAGLR